MSRFIQAVFLVIFSANVIANNLVKVTLNDETYMIIDVRLNSKIKLVEGVEVFIHEGEYMLPLYTFTDALGMNVSINTEKSEFTLEFNGDKTQIYFADNLIESTLFVENTNIVWGGNGFDIYVPQRFLETLINATVDAKISNLIFEITSLDKKTLYPVELDIQREIKLGDRRLRENREVNVNLRQVFIEDQYRLVMPPNMYANVRYRIKEDQKPVTSQPNGSVQTNTDNIVYKDTVNVALAGTSDLFYHSARYAINWNDGADVQSTIKFSKYKTSPYDVLPGNVDYYAFGDVSGYASSLTNSDSGLGLTFSQKEDRYSNEFGQTTIDGIASPGWQVELYDGGYFIGETIVNDNGQYIFNEVSTRYGVNQYRIVLYGPYGEVETRYETIRIGSNWLNAGEISYRGAILDSGKRLLSSNQGDSGYEIDTVNFGFDYGLTDGTQLQLMYHQNESFEGNVERYLSSQVQVNFSSNALTVGMASKEGAGHAVELGLLGRLHNLDSYGLNLTYADDYDLVAGVTDNPIWQMSGSYHSEFDFFGKKIIDLYNISSLVEQQYDSFINRARISWGLDSLSMRFELANSQFNSYLGSQHESSITTASLSGAGKVGDGRLTLSTTRQLGNSDYSEYQARYQNSFDSLLLYTSANYTKTADSDSWGAGAQVAYRTRYAFISSAIDYNSESKWQFSLGFDFSFGYDYQRNTVEFSSSYKQTAMLDVGAFLDRNNNYVLDEGDYALEGVKFGPFSNWAELPTLKNGRTLLTPLPVKNVVNIDAKWRDVVKPSQGRHTLYTHPGGLVSADIPFTITTSMAGYVLFNNDNELIGANGIRVNLIDIAKNKTIDSEIADEDGFFEFYDHKAGHYLIEVEIDDVLKRGLTISHRRFELITPSRGGFVELDAFILNYGVTQNDKTIFVDLNDGNYEPLFSGDANDKEIYVHVTDVLASDRKNKQINTEEKDLAINGKSIKRTSIKLIPDVPITQIPLNNEDGKEVNFDVSNVGADNSVDSLTSELTGIKTTESTLVNSGNTVKVDKSFTRLEWRYGAQIAVFSSAKAADKFIESLDVKGIPIKAYYDEDNKLYRLILGELTTNLSDVETSIGKYKITLSGKDMFAKYFRVLVSY